MWMFLLFQLSHIQSQADLDLDNPANIRAELMEKIKENNNLKNELERVKKDKNITSGLVTQMQRDMGNKVRQLLSEICTQPPALPVKSCTPLYILSLTECNHITLVFKQKHYSGQNSGKAFWQKYAYYSYSIHFHIF